MALATGGTAVGAINTRSSPSSWAFRRAAAVGMISEVLLLLGVVLLLLLLVLIVAVVDGLGDGWNRRGSDQYEIESQLLGLPQGGGGGHDFRGAVGEHRAHFPCTDRSEERRGG